MQVPKVFCETYGSDETGLQRILCNVSNENFADINYALDAAKKVQFVCEDEELGFPASFSGFIHHTTTNDILVISKTMRQHIAGRVINCAEELAYKVDDMLNGDAYMDFLFGLSYRTADDILDAKKLSDFVGTRNNSYKRIDVFGLDDTRKYILARVCRNLMKGQRVALRISRASIPAGWNYEEYSMLILQQILEVLPQRDRCLISFATACKENALKTMDKIQLLLTDDTVSEDTTDGAVWLTLDEVKGEELTEQETIYLKWCNTEWGVRKEFERSEHFTAKTEDAGRAQNAILERDAQRLERFFHPRFYWWQSQNGKMPERRIHTLKQLLHEFEENPSLDISVYRKNFLENIDDVLGNDTGTVPAFMEKWEGEFVLTDQDRTDYHDRLANLIYDGLMSKPNSDDTTQVDWALSPDDIKKVKVPDGFKTLFKIFYGKFLIKDNGKTQPAKDYREFMKDSEQLFNNVMGN